MFNWRVLQRKCKVDLQLWKTTKLIREKKYFLQAICPLLWRNSACHVYPVFDLVQISVFNGVFRNWQWAALSVCENRIFILDLKTKLYTNIFIQTFSIRTRGCKIPTFKNILTEDISDVEEKRRILIGNYTNSFFSATAQNHGSNLSVNVRQCTIAHSVVRVQFLWLLHSGNA